MTDSIMEATKDKAPSQTDVLAPSLAVQEREKLERDIKRAEAKSALALDELKKREKARKEAPEGVWVPSILDDDPMDVMARRLVPEAFRKEPKSPKLASRQYDYKPGVTMRTYWDIAEKHKQNVNNGWIPVADEDGEHASVNELFLYKRNIELTREAVYSSARRAKEMLKTKDDSIRKVADGDGGQVFQDDLVVKKQKI